MEANVKVDLGAFWGVLMVLIGVFEAWATGVSILAGAIAGIMINIIVAAFGFIPVLGIILYKHSYPIIFHVLHIPTFRILVILGWVGLIVEQIIVYFLIAIFIAAVIVGRR